MRTLTNKEVACIENARRRAAAQGNDTEIPNTPSLTDQFRNQGKMAGELADLFFGYPAVEISDD